MGSNLQSSQMPDSKRDAFLKAFGKLKQKVLWKWETDTLPGQPKNVRLGKWLPQSDILAHPNIRLFITHGGLLSTQEALDRGVPVVGIPVFADQFLNSNRAVLAGYGIRLDYSNVTEESLLWAVKEVIDHPK
ncbi:UDP-glucuronosyltransferase [Blattella germanica]|nr:UDP-glucuronosyltransferase [Blattella germanica]